MLVRQSMVSSMISGCPRQVYLTYIELLPHKQSVALFLGSVFHETYAWYFHLKSIEEVVSLLDLVETYSHTFERLLKRQEVDIKETQLRETKELGMSLVTTYYKTASKMDVQDVEVEGKLGIGEDVVSTHIDVLLKNKGIVELKTARVYKYRGVETFPDYKSS